MLEHGEPPFGIAGAFPTADICYVDFATTIFFSSKEPMDTSFGCQRADLRPQTLIVPWVREMLLRETPGIIRQRKPSACHREELLTCFGSP
jgi:hypothetical protein